MINETVGQDPEETIYYASLIGPLRGAYYPLPSLADSVGAGEVRRAALMTSKLRSLWANIFTEEEVDRQIKEYGEGFKLPLSMRLGYDSHQVMLAGQGAAWRSD